MDIHIVRARFRDKYQQQRFLSKVVPASHPCRNYSGYSHTEGVSPNETGAMVLTSESAAIERADRAFRAVWFADVAGLRYVKQRLGGVPASFKSIKLLPHPAGAKLTYCRGIQDNLPYVLFETYLPLADVLAAIEAHGLTAYIVPELISPYQGGVMHWGTSGTVSVLLTTEKNLASLSKIGRSLSDAAQRDDYALFRTSYAN